MNKPTFFESRRRPGRLRAVLAALTLALAGLTASAAAAPAAAHAATGTADFRGVNWADPRDNYADDPVVPSGLNTSDSYATVKAKATAILTGFRTNLGANTVRLPVNPYSVGTGWWKAYTGAVDAATGMGFKVILGYWEGPSHKDGTIDDTAAWNTMWNTVTARYGGNSAVYFEPMNEPFGYSSSAWADIAAGWLAAHPAVPRNRVFVSGTGYNENVTSECADSRLNGTYLSLHNYGFWATRSYTEWMADFRNRIGACASRTVLDEFGAPMTTGLNYDDAAGTDNFVAYLRAATDTVRSLSMGSVYWPGLRGGDSYSMETLHGSGTNLTLTTNNATGADRLRYGWGLTSGGGTNRQSTQAASVTEYPGAVWQDTSGNVIQAHGGGIVKDGGTYYWLGEDKTDGSPFQNIRCYSSTDLKNWTFVRNVLTRQPSGDLGPDRVVERPHVIHNSSTGQYVMYMHIDNSNYSERKAGVATSGSVCGAYSYRGSFKPLGHDSLDDNLFLDGGTGYFMSEDRTDGQLQVYRLSSDFLSVSALVKSLPQYEAPAMARIGGTYYLFGSHLTGWSTNDNQYATATSITGTWSSWRSFAPSGTSTCNSQTTSILPVAGSSTTGYVFMGDRWNAGDLSDSRYVWEPLTVSGTTASIACRGSWTVDTQTGTVGGTDGSGISSALRGTGSGRCLDVPNGSTANSVRTDIWDCNAGTNQLWTLNASKELVVYGTKCLDASGGGTAPGTAVITYDCHGGTNQQWNLNGDGTVTNAASGLCLDVTGAAVANGTSVELWTCNGGANQQWTRQ